MRRWWEGGEKWKCYRMLLLFMLRYPVYCSYYVCCIFPILKLHFPLNIILFPSPKIPSKLPNSTTPHGRQR